MRFSYLYLYLVHRFREMAKKSASPLITFHAIVESLPHNTCTYSNRYCTTASFVILTLLHKTVVVKTLLISYCLNGVTVICKRSLIFAAFLMLTYVSQYIDDSCQLYILNLSGFGAIKNSNNPVISLWDYVKLV